MRKYLSKIEALFFLTVFGIAASCNGQVKEDLPKEKTIESKTLLDDRPKLKKAQRKNPGNNVHCSIQDKDGNLWFATTGDGVFKYDGKSFIQFTTANGLNSNTVWSIFQDKSSNIWIGTEAGACLYDGKKFTVIQIPLRKNCPSHSKSRGSRHTNSSV